MTFTLIGAFGAFDPSKRDGLVANQSIAGFAAQDPTSQAALLQGSYAPISYDFRAFATTDTNDAATAVLDLTARGMTIPTGFSRVIYVDYYCKQSTVAAVGGLRRYVGSFQGGTTPTVHLATATWLNAMSATITVQATLAIVSNNITVNVAGVSALTLNHEVRVYVSPLISSPV